MERDNKNSANIFVDVAHPVVTIRTAMLEQAAAMQTVRLIIPYHYNAIPYRRNAIILITWQCTINQLFRLTIHKRAGEQRPLVESRLSRVYLYGKVQDGKNMICTNFTVRLVITFLLPAMLGLE